MSTARLAVMAVVCFGLVGCPKDEKVDETDRTIAQLKAEKERLEKGGAPARAPSRPQSPEAEALAEAAAQAAPGQPLQLREAQGSFGALTITVKSAEVSRNVKGAKTAVSTPDRFLKLVLGAKATKPETLELGTLVLSRAGETATVARDVQRVAQGSPLGATSLDADIEHELVVYFELPEAMIAPGLTLQLKAAGRSLDLPLL